LTGYQKVILIDALFTGKYPQGKVISFPLNSMVDLNAGHSSSAHDTSLRNALDVGRSMKISLPRNENITVVAVEAANVYEFSRELSPLVADAVPRAVNLVLELLSKTEKE
jgi:hydrogenase maturation protease